MCGDIGKAQSCTKGAVTAAGHTFKPHTIPSAAVPAPTKQRMHVHILHLRLQGVQDAPCVAIILNDKANPRWIGKRGFDLSPAAVRALTGKEPTRHWSGKVEECLPKEKLDG